MESKGQLKEEPEEEGIVWTEEEIEGVREETVWE